MSSGGILLTYTRIIVNSTVFLSPKTSYASVTSCANKVSYTAANAPQSALSSSEITLRMQIGNPRKHTALRVCLAIDCGSLTAINVAFPMAEVQASR